MIANLPGSARDRLVRGWEVAATEKGLFSASVSAAVRELQTRPLEARDVREPAP